MLLRRKHILRLTSVVLTTAYVALAVVLASFHSHTDADCRAPHTHAGHVHECSGLAPTNNLSADRLFLLDAQDLKTAPDHCLICQFYGKQIFAEVAAPAFVGSFVAMGDRPEFTSITRPLPADLARGPPLV